MQRAILVSCFMFSLAMLTCFSSVTSATDYYVAPSGSDANDGSINNPWRTPQRAADVVVAGDTVILRQGTYRVDQAASQMINFANPGTAGAPITLKAYPGETAELTGLMFPANWSCRRDVCFTDGLTPTQVTETTEEIAVVVQNDVALEPVGSLNAAKNQEGTTYWDAGRDRLHVHPIGGRNNIDQIQVSQVTDQIIVFDATDQHINIGSGDSTLKISGSFYGIRAKPDSGNHVLTNIQFRHFREDGVKFNTTGNTNDTVQYCFFSSIGDAGIDTFGSNNQTFKSNRFSEVHHWKSGGAIKLIGGASGIVIDGNLAESLGGTGGQGAFEIIDGTNIDIHNNIIANPAGSAILVYSLDSTSTAVRIINNSIYRTGGSAIWIAANSENVSVYNNVVDNSTATGSNSRALRVDSGAQTGFSSDYNDFYRPDSSDVVQWLGTNFTLAGFQNESGHDANSLDLNPLYTNPAAGNFVHLQGSPVIDAGSNAVAPDYDYDGISRPAGTSVDMGAYETESGGDPPPASPANLSATAGDGIVDLDWDDNSEPDLDGYNVYRSLTSGGPYALINTGVVAASAFSDTTVNNGTEYFYVVTAVDTAGNASGNSNEAFATPQVGGAPTIRVDSIVVTTVNAGQGNKRGRAVVTIRDNNGDPVSAAEVHSTFSGDINEAVSGTTDSSGVVTLDTGGTHKGGTNIEFCVDDVTHPTLGYDPTANVETCDTN